MILMYFFETYLDLRQHAAHKLPTLPKTLEGVISQEKFEKSRAYSLDKRFVCWVVSSFCWFLKELLVAFDRVLSGTSFDDGKCRFAILIHIWWTYFPLFQPLPLRAWVCVYTDGLCNFVVWDIALVLEGMWVVIAAMRLSIWTCCIISFFFVMQRSGEFLVLAGLNVENEILHTLAFLAGVMIWSQVY